MRIEENRKFARWNISRPVRFSLAGKDNEEEKMALLKDISFAGARMSLFESLRLNDKLDMFLEIPDEEHAIHCEGKVVWQKSPEDMSSPPFACGLSFTKIKDQDKEKMFKYMSQNAADEVKKKWWEGVK